MTLNEKMSSMETETRKGIHRVLSTGNEKLLEIDRALSRVDGEDWSVPGVKRHLGQLRAKAEKTLRRAGELPGEAVSRLASGTRAPIQNLARGLAEMAKKVEPPAARQESGTAANRPVAPRPARSGAARRAEADPSVGAAE